MSHDFRTAETVVKWVLQTLRGRLKKGREVLLKNPWVNVVAAEAPGGFGERGDLQLPHWRGPVQICKLDQCMYGLTDVSTGLPHRKSTGMLLSSEVHERTAFKAK